MCVRSVDIMCYYVILVLDVYECDFLSLFCFCHWLFVVYFLYALGRPRHMFYLYIEYHVFT